MWVYIMLNMQTSRTEKVALKNEDTAYWKTTTNQIDQAWNVEDWDLTVFLVVERDFILFCKSSYFSIPLVVGALLLRNTERKDSPPSYR